MDARALRIWTLCSQVDSSPKAAALEWMESLEDFCSSVVQVFLDRERAQHQRRGSDAQGGLRAQRWAQGATKRPSRPRAPPLLQ